jgi:soluble lytic murein transglycosylase
MTDTPTSRRPSHRSDRYKAESGTAPSTELLQRLEETSDTEATAETVTTAATYHRRRSAVPVTVEPEPVQERPVQQVSTPVRRRQIPAEEPVQTRSSSVERAPREATPPPKMDRPVKASVREKERAKKKMPTWLVAMLAIMFFLSAGLFTAQSLMQAYLTQCQQEREAAYQRVVDAHPIYYKDLIEQYAAENNLQPAFVEAIILNESSYRTDAESSVGARGLMQLMPDTAEWIAGKLKDSSYHVDNLYDAETNIKYGTWYLGYLSKLFRGDPILVSAAYHAGQGEVTGWLSDPSMSEDGVTIKLENMIDGPTKRYAGRVTKAYGVYEALYYSTDTADDDGTVPDSVDSAHR